MQISYQGKVEQVDVRRAAALHYQPSKASAVVRALVLALIVFSFGFVMITQSMLLTPALVLGILIPIAVFAFPWWIPFVTASSYNQPGNIYKDPIKGVIDDVGITLLSKNQQTNTKWDAFVYSKRSKDMILLYQNKNCFNVFTRSLFCSEEEWKAFLKCVEERLKPV